MAVLLSRAANRFVTERRQVGEIRPTSATTYRVILTGFVDAVGHDKPTDQLTRADCRRWWAGLSVSPKTARGRLSCVNTFCKWCVDRQWMRFNPADGIKSPRPAQSLPVVLSPGQIRAVLDAAPDARARIVVLLMLQLGLRAAEVARLQTTDVDLAGMLIRIQGKGGHEAILPIPKELELALVPWLRQTPGSGPLIRRLRGSSWATLAPATVGVIVRQVMIDAGVKQRRGDGISGHALRRTAITDVARAGAPLPAVQGFSRHLAVGSLRPYLRVTDAEDLRRFIEGRSYTKPG